MFLNNRYAILAVLFYALHVHFNMDDDANGQVEKYKMFFQKPDENQEKKLAQIKKASFFNIFVSAFCIQESAGRRFFEE